MAQTGFTPIQIYSSSTAAAAPAAGNLANTTLGSELAINITDGKLFYKDNANAVQVIAWKVTPTTAGGTGLSSYVAGDLVYYASGTTFTKLAIGASGRYLSSSGTAPQWTAPAALTKTDDTNVTLTLGGSASTALLNAASLTLGWTGSLAVSRGGTGTGTAGITAFNNITGYTASGATGTTSTNLVFSTSPSITTPTLVGNVTLSTGDLVIGTSGKGIDFSATPGTGTSELLADYEEGTWTPTLTTTGTNFTSVTLDIERASYTKIGRVVYVTGTIRSSAVTIGAASGFVVVGGLPFTVNATYDSALTVSYADSWASNTPRTGRFNNNATNFYLINTPTANGDYALNAPASVATGASSNRLDFSGYFFV